MNNERNNTTAGGSWLWVLAPIWIPTAITLAIIVIVLVVILVRELTKGGRP